MNGYPGEAASPQALETTVPLAPSAELLSDLDTATRALYHGALTTREPDPYPGWRVDHEDEKVSFARFRERVDIVPATEGGWRVTHSSTPEDTDQYERIVTLSFGAPEQEPTGSQTVRANGVANIVVTNRPLRANECRSADALLRDIVAAGNARPQPRASSWHQRVTHAVSFLLSGKRHA